MMNERSHGGHALFTDLYELTMLRAYGELGMDAVAVFDLFFRKLPPQRNYLLACGLDPFLEDLENLSFSKTDLAYLASNPLFSKAFIDRLENFRFTGDVHAVPEGTPVFPNEPILEIVAPISQAQLIETFVLNQIGLQTILASKATRIVAAAQGRPVVDFGARRAQGLDAAIKGTRAFFIAGAAATSNVAAGQLWGIPVAGTMAHSFVQACSSEAEAFRKFAEVFPDTILLVDTYDTLAGVRRVVALASELGADCRIRGVRLDSGDLVELSKGARSILDAAGLQGVQIFASGGLDEHRIAELLSRGAPIDAFGVGTSMSVSDDAPALDIAYKLVKYAGLGRMKLSAGKRMLPGRKQIFRTRRNGLSQGDVIGRAQENLAGVPLLQPVVKDGRRIAPVPSLTEIRDHARRSITQLPESLRMLEASTSPYPVTISDDLQEHEREVRRRILAQI
ncbi:nicotinate phosphoribosyltransferase [Microvirga sp. Mcv34]|uniref:nicotinate phosphoribosyltransferase n=1 Tax=Microvirga sp. Mcv34 TaxID=2926016 RepID=UPI0021C857C6|nr:nicotinate phosphoribosyltransferase [Microvirga sp. Mcv34]